jgi:hypothetical protein
VKEKSEAVSWWCHVEVSGAEHNVSLDKLGMVQTLDDDFLSMRSYMVGKETLMGRRT